MFYGYVALVLTILMTLSIGISTLIAGSVYSLATKPRYTASVVSASSRESEGTDSQNRRTQVTMYTPAVTFTGADGTRVDVPTDVSSRDRPIMGSQVTVLYAPGDTVAQEVSVTKFGLLLGASAMLFLMGLALVGALQIARGASTDGVRRIAARFVLLVLMPLALLGMLAGIVYAVWQYFAGARPDMPLWAVILCCFFSLVIPLMLETVVRMGLAPDSTWRTRPTPPTPTQPPGPPT